MKIKCFKCNTVTPLYRNNEKGVPAIWACAKHCTYPVDKQVRELTERELTELIHKGQK